MRACARVALVLVALSTSFGLAGCAAIDELKETFLRWVESERLPSGPGLFATIARNDPCDSAGETVEKGGKQAVKSRSNQRANRHSRRSLRVRERNRPSRIPPRRRSRKAPRGNPRRLSLRRCDCAVPIPKHRHRDVFHTGRLYGSSIASRPRLVDDGSAVPERDFRAEPAFDGGRESRLGGRSRRRGVRRGSSRWRPSAAECPPSGPDWVHEIKHDGYRLMARHDPVGVRLLTRNGYDWSPRYPKIVGAVNALKVRSCLIDGEAVACDDNGLAVFERLRSKGAGQRGIPLRLRPTGA